MSGLVEKYGSGTITALNGTVVISAANDSATCISITGTWSATLVVEATVDDSNWFSIVSYSTYGQPQSTITANDNVFCSAAGVSQLRVRASAYTSGTVAVAWNSDTGTPPQAIYSTDVCNSGGTQGAITVSTSAVLAAVSGTNLANRKSLTVYNNGTAAIYWGHTSGVTSSTGTPIVAGEKAAFRYSDSANIYLIAASGSHNVRLTESA